ncbi:YhjD/YihY/BrkB family envelope integrity protein [Halanaerobacter jeridensis]|uniref:Membrane protein n=1 Tax=Halanaerobacter jeridensis TaxID=706427 RepID=A0A938XZ48_9FIRM|nr:YhjD/YihY/BrkB family envelope integrity protein [Halanaerobacter jeridensis]MBM7557970.1 membrane protein [Halanaerobacter jeridensis]
MANKILNFEWKLFLKRIYQKSEADDIFIHAMSLVYTTLLSLIPLLIFSFYILTLFNFFGGMEKLIAKLKIAILNNLATGTGESLINVLEQYIINIDQLGVISFGTLVVVIIFMLARIEVTFNRIWGVKEHRDLFKRFVAFWTFITLGTFLFTLLLSLTLGLASSYFQAQITGESLFNSFLFKFISNSGYFLVFIAAYYLIPNTEVELSAAVVGGMSSGTFFVVAKQLYTFYTKHVVTYNQIYGPLAVIPLFLIWLYVIWVIALLGAIISYVFQYRRQLNNFIHQEVTIGTKGLLPIAILVIIHKGFLDKEQAGVTFQELADKIKLPIATIKDNLQELKENNLITESKENKYLPLVSLDEISLWEIFSNHKQIKSRNVEDIFADDELQQIYCWLKGCLKEDLTGLTINQLLNKIEEGEKNEDCTL